MADVGFHRADGQGLRAQLRQALAERIGFHGVAHLGAGAVRLDECKFAGINAEVSVDLLQQSPLRLRRGQG